MPANRWLDRSQPQTLLFAVILMYVNAAFGLLEGAFLNPLGLVLVILPVLAAWGISNEKKWAYWLGVVLAALNLAFAILDFSSASLINLLFTIALLCLLLHPQSREYRRIWFK